MSKRDGYEPGMPVPQARLQYCVTAAPPDSGGATSTVSQLMIASHGA
jgi:hypothetical protein